MVRQEVVAGTMWRVDINDILKVAVPIENQVEYVLGSWSVPFLGTRNENYIALKISFVLQRFR